METVEILRYGALGLCVILLSFVARLIYTEQKRPNSARKPILKNINYLLVSSLVLTALFGYTEFALKSKTDPTIEASIDKVWNASFSEHQNDSTIVLKAKRILENNLPVAQTVNDTTAICDTYISELADIKKEIANLDKDFYTNILLLRREIENAGGDFINIDWNVENKKQVYDILKTILIKLDRISNQNATHEEIRKAWKATKRTFTSKTPKYIVDWDLAQLVRIYINKFYPRIQK